MKRLMTVVLVALLSLGVASLSMAQEETPGMQGGSSAKHKKSSSKKHSKHKKKGTSKKPEQGSTGEEMK